MNRSKTSVSRWRDWIGRREEGPLAEASVEPKGKGSEVYGFLTSDRYVPKYVERSVCMQAMLRHEKKVRVFSKPSQL